MKVWREGNRWRCYDISLKGQGWESDSKSVYTEDPFKAAVYLNKMTPSAREAYKEGVVGTYDIPNQIKASYALKTDFSPVYTPPYEKWDDYQRAGIEYAIAPRRLHAVIADGLGLGKTQQGVGVGNEVIAGRVPLASRKGKLLVVCPAATRMNWEMVIRLWGLEGDLQQTLRTGLDIFDSNAKWYIVSHDLAASSLNEQIGVLTSERRISLAIIDEIHYMKDMKTRRYTRLLGARKGVLRKAQKIVGLTGTPGVNRPYDLFPLFHLMALGLLPEEARTLKGFGKIYSPRKKYLGKTPSDQTIQYYKHQESLRLMELNVRSRMFMIIREKADALPNLKKKTLRLFYLEPNTKANKVIADLNTLLDLTSESFNILSGEKQRAVAYGEALLLQIQQRRSATDKAKAAWSTLRRELGIAKAPPILDYLKVLLSKQDKVVVMVHHREVGDILIDGLSQEGYNPVMIRGGVSERKRRDALNAFTNDPATRVFIGQITSAGVGLNLQVSCCLVMAEPSPVPAQNDQAMDRVHRRGQERDVVIYFPLFANSLDEAIFMIDKNKRGVLDKVRNKKYIT